jgi:hypothetical protein
MAVGFDGGGVDIQGDALGRAVVAFQEQIDEEILEMGRLGCGRRASVRTGAAIHAPLTTPE